MSISEESTPLLTSVRDSIHVVEEEAKCLSSSSNEPDDPTPKLSDSRQRLDSLDVFRGITVALMILVDNAGGAFPVINHSPWFGVTLADFVMPFFLFGVGVSISLVFKKVSNKTGATKKVVNRTIKLFLLGLLIQGGYLHGYNDLTYGVDLANIRVLGVLQRIAIGYFLASLSEIWLVNHSTVDSSTSFVKKYYFQWMVALLLCVFYMCLLYGLYVPDWEFEAANLNLPFHGSGTQTVHCGVRGSLEPPCNAVGFIDRYILGEHHLYQRPVYRRTKECSINSPDYGPLPADSPVWCLAPFDPEGLLSSVMAAVTCFVGLHFGHILLHYKVHMQRVLLWSLSSLPLLVLGYALVVLGIPLSKPLYTLSYMFITAGASGLFLTSIYYMVDVYKLERITLLFKWMGLNALIIYVLATSSLLLVIAQSVYWHSPENNLISWVLDIINSWDNLQIAHSFLRGMPISKNWGTLVLVLLEILGWGLFAGFLDHKGIYIKL